MYKNRIAEFAAAKGVKHSHLAKLCKVSNQTFSRWVNNKSQPDIIQGFIIAKALNVRMEELIKEEKNERTEHH
jgi:putative transcriptional regulator